MNSYYWGEPDASVSFCEDKYTTLPWVAEYYNTLSSLIYIVAGIVILNEKTYHISFDLILLGIATFLFHMTIRSWAQILDESAMILLSYDVISDITKIRRIYVIPILTIYLWLHDYFIFFLLLFASMQIYLTKLGLEKTKGLRRKYLFLYIIFFTLGLVCWLGDQLLCGYLNKINLHYYWHNLSGLGIMFGLLAIR
jgi:dihydroceramidase